MSSHDAVPALEARDLTKHFRLRGRSRGKAVHAVDGVDLAARRVSGGAS